MLIFSTYPSCLFNGVLRCCHVIESRKKRGFSTHVSNFLKEEMPSDPLLLSDTFTKYVDAITNEYEAMAHSSPLNVQLAELAQVKQRENISRIWRAFARQ